MSKLIPLGENLVILPLKEDTTKSSFYIPESKDAKPGQGEVIAVGPGKVTDDGKRQKPELSKGDRIMFAKYAGTEVKIDGEDLLIMREDDVLAVVN